MFPLHLPADAARSRLNDIARGFSMNYRMFLIVAMVTAAPATLAFADDPANSHSKTTLDSRPTAAEFEPMTRSERFRDYLSSLVDGQAIFVAAASAGIRQAEDVPREWRGGAEGYGYRIGNSFAQEVIRRTLQHGAAAVLREDNRYFASGEQGFFRRTKYAVRSTFLARHDNGRQYLSFSRFGGAAGSAFISRIWQPHSTNSAGDGAVSFGFAIGTDVGFNVLREFWPDVKRRFRKE
jgi:hypothetical protein